MYIEINSNKTTSDHGVEGEIILDRNTNWYYIRQDDVWIQCEDIGVAIIEQIKHNERRRY